MIVKYLRLNWDSLTPVRPSTQNPKTPKRKRKGEKEKKKSQEENTQKTTLLNIPAIQTPKINSLKQTNDRTSPSTCH